MAWLWIGEDAKSRREDVAVAGQSCIGIILIKRQKIEIETGFPYDIRLVEEAAPEDEVETFAVPFDFVIQDAFLVVGQSLQRKSIEERQRFLVAPIELQPSSEGRRVGKECVITFKSRWSPLN